MTGLDQISSISLPCAPLQTVNSVQYFDNSDAATVWSSSNYFVDTIREPGRLVLRMGAENYATYKTDIPVVEVRG